MLNKGADQPYPLKITSVKSILTHTIPHEKKSLRCFTGKLSEADIITTILFLLQVP